MIKALVALYIGVLVLIAIFIPLKVAIGGAKVPYGYSFIWSLRSPHLAVDVERIIFEIIAVTAVAAVLFFILIRGKRR